ncbi:MAG: hypothetical protein KatS3mg103_0711 [Phycisphaerales bacterium]|nr:MAG: hypothetical protein KatS3mg103_0711 [Phycisphaerales bacterium]
MPIADQLSTPLAFIGPLGPMEIGAILLIAVLLFGRRLPDVGRNVGRAIIEFKRGVKGITDEIEDASRTPDPRDVVPPRRPARRPAGAGSGQRPVAAGNLPRLGRGQPLQPGSLPPGSTRRRRGPARSTILQLTAPGRPAACPRLDGHGHPRRRVGGGAIIHACVSASRPTVPSRSCGSPLAR